MHTCFSPALKGRFILSFSSSGKGTLRVMPRIHAATFPSTAFQISKVEVVAFIAPFHVLLCYNSKGSK